MSTDRIIMYTLLLFHLKSSTCSETVRPHTRFPSNCPDCIRTITSQVFEPLKWRAILKAEILRRLGIKDDNHRASASARTIKQPPVPEPVQGRQREMTENAFNHLKDMTDVISLSEPPDRFTDNHIIQFKLSNNTSGGQLLVKRANILVRVRYKKARRRQKKELRRTKRDRRRKMIALNVSTVDSEGKPNRTITSVNVTLKRAKWLRLTLPLDLVQNVIDSNDKTLQFYVQCVGCGRRANIILVHKNGKRARSNRKRPPRLHKRRPMLYMQTQLRGRQKRQTFRTSTLHFPSQPHEGVPVCRGLPVQIDMYELGFHSVISPTVFNTFYCMGTCSGRALATAKLANLSTSQFENQPPTGEYGNPFHYKHLKKRYNQRLDDEHFPCKPVQAMAQSFVYLHNGDLQTITVPDIVVTECGCTKMASRH